MTVSDTMKAPFAAAAYSQSAVKALMDSSHVWAAGCQRLGDLMATNARGQFERSTATWEAMGQAKSIQEAMGIQTGYVRTSAEHAMSSARQMIEVTTQLTQETMAR